MSFKEKLKRTFIRSPEEQMRRDKQKEAEKEAYQKEKIKQSKDFGKWKAEQEAKKRKKNYQGGGFMGQLERMTGGGNTKKRKKRKSGRDPFGFDFDW